MEGKEVIVLSGIQWAGMVPSLIVVLYWKGMDPCLQGKQDSKSSVSRESDTPSLENCGMNDLSLEMGKQRPREVCAIK